MINKNITDLVSLQSSFFSFLFYFFSKFFFFYSLILLFVLPHDETDQTEIYAMNMDTMPSLNSTNRARQKKMKIITSYTWW